MKFDINAAENALNKVLDKFAEQTAGVDDIEQLVDIGRSALSACRVLAAENEALKQVLAAKERPDGVDPGFYGRLAGKTAVERDSVKAQLAAAEEIVRMVAEGAPHNWLLSAKRSSANLYDFLKDLDQRALKAWAIIGKKS